MTPEAGGFAEGGGERKGHEPAQERPLTGAAKIGDLSVKLAGAALIARERGDDVQALFFAIKAAETLALAKALGWSGSANKESQTP